MPRELETCDLCSPVVSMCEECAGVARGAHSDDTMQGERGQDKREWVVCMNHSKPLKLPQRFKYQMVACRPRGEVKIKPSQVFPCRRPCEPDFLPVVMNNELRKGGSVRVNVGEPSSWYPA